MMRVNVMSVNKQLVGLLSEHCTDALQFNINPGHYVFGGFILENIG